MFSETEIKQIVAVSVLLAATKCTKFVFGRGSAPDPAGGAHEAPPDPLVGWGGGHPLPIPPRRLRRLDSHAFGVRLGGAFGASLPAFRHFFFHSLSTGPPQGLVDTPHVPNPEKYPDNDRLRYYLYCRV